MENIDKIYDLLNDITVTKENESMVREIKDLLATENYMEALRKMRELKDEEERTKEQEDLYTENEDEEEGTYPEQLSNIDLEEEFIGLLLENPKLISKYYFIFDICMFEDPEM